MYDTTLSCWYSYTLKMISPDNTLQDFLKAKNRGDMTLN